MVFHDFHSADSRFHGWLYLFAFAFLLQCAFGPASIAKEKPSANQKTVSHHKKYKKHRRLIVVSHHAKKTVRKKPSLIRSQILRTPPAAQHTPPPGHDGEEHSDWFWQRRAWPNRTIDPSAYPTALAEAARMPMYSPLTQQGEGVGGEAPLSSFEWQPIGPYSIDGRASAIATDPLDSNTFYIGAAAGGLWKTTDHGTNWRCVTDTFGSLSIGCVTIDPLYPDTLYIGLGECNGSADSYPGDGLWKSTDGGNSWNYLGFANAQYIAKILIDPRNDKQLFIAVPGPNALADTNKGIFRTTDGGATWTRALFVRPNAGDCIGFIDIAMDPLNSADLVAAAWDHSITIGSNFTPGGPGGPNTGVYRSTDTGHTWTRIDTLSATGLPNGQSQKVLGRIALLWTLGGGKYAKDYLFAGFIRADTNPVTHYMTDENFEGLYSSTNQGVTWKKILDSTIRIPMGGVQGKDSANITNAQGGYDFYLAAGPLPQDDRNVDIYLGGIDVFRSTDLGANWKDITNSYSQYYVKANREQHSDQHGVAFAGTDLLCVNDGGVFETRDFGTNWHQMTGLPITQFYAIEPWRGGMANTPATISANDLKVFGGTQDNGTVGNLQDTSFAWINHGDGEAAISHPTDSNKLITSLEFGVIFARNTLDSLVPLPLDMKDTTQDTRPRWHTITCRLLYGPHPLTDTEEAVAWNAPLALDDEEPTELYTGRCHVYRATLDWNDLENTTWRTWSPPIEGNTGKDSTWYYGDIETVALGPRDAAGHPIIWAGGYGTSSVLWRTTVDPTRSDTTAPHWITARNGLPNATVSQVVPDRSDSLTAFCAIVSASKVAHVLMTTNGGKKWTNISGNLPSTAPVSALVIDTLNEHGDPLLKNQVLIAGTDVGVFATTNGGSEWFNLAPGMPHVIVSDLKIYKNMLIAATHGRSLYALDISSLAGVPSAVAASVPGKSSSLTIYPNPVIGAASFSVWIQNAGVSAPRIVGDASCRMVELSSGRSFAEPVEVVGAGEFRIQIDSQRSPGAYLVELLSGNRILGEGRVSIAR